MSIASRKTENTGCANKDVSKGVMAADSISFPILTLTLRDAVEERVEGLGEVDNPEKVFE